MRRIVIILIIISVACRVVAQNGDNRLKHAPGSPYLTGVTVNFPYGDITNQITVQDTVILTATGSPSTAFGYNFKWSVEVGNNCLALLDTNPSDSGLFRAIQPGTAEIKCLAMDGSGVFVVQQVVIVDTCMKLSTFDMTFVSGNTNAWIGEHAFDSLPVFTISQVGGVLDLAIDKAGPLDSVTLWPLASYKTWSYGFSAMRLSLCPVNGFMMDMRNTPIITMKFRTTKTGIIQLGYASEYNGPVFVSRYVEASENFSLVSFNYGGIPSGGVDSSNVADFYMTFNPGVLNTRSNPTAAGDTSLHHQPFDFKGTFEIQYIEFGDGAEIIPVQQLVISGDTIITTKMRQLYTSFAMPYVATNPLVKWSISDTTIATLVPYTIDSGLHCVSKIYPRKTGTVTINATTLDGTNLTAEKKVEIVNKIVSLNTVDDLYQIYPNPVNDVLNIDGSQDIVTLWLYNITGQLVKTEINHHNSILNIEMNNLSSGVYLLKIQTQQGECYFKNIIKR